MGTIWYYLDVLWALLTGQAFLWQHPILDDDCVVWYSEYNGFHVFNIPEYSWQTTINDKYTKKSAKGLALARFRNNLW